MKSEQPKATTPTFEQRLLAALDAANGNASEAVGRIYSNITSNRPDPQLVEGYERWRRQPEPPHDLLYNQSHSGAFERGAMFNFITRLDQLRKMPPVADQVAERMKLLNGISENNRFWREARLPDSDATVK